jgi:colanic acid/amylovoran biosynthesis glycosyltransferase
MIKRLGLVMDHFPVISQVFVANEVNAFDEMGLDVSVYSLSSPSSGPMHEEARRWLSRTNYVKEAISPGILRAHAYFLAHEPKRYLRLGLQVRSIGKRDFIASVYLAWLARQADNQHIHAYFAWAANPAYVIAQLNHISFSVTLINTDIYAVPPSNLGTLINEAAFCVTISDYNRCYLLKTYHVSSPERLYVVYHSIRPSKFLRQGKKPFPDVYRLLTIARLVPMKNIPLLLQICRRLADDGYRFQCDIVGDGPDRTVLENLASKLCLGRSVQFRGNMTQEELLRFYHAADVFILTSDREGMPVVLMEAMAAEVPVVAPRVTGIPELVEDGLSGLLFPPKDLDKAAEAVKRLLDDQNLRIEMGKNGREKVMRDCDIAKNAPRLVRLFNSAISCDLGQS